MSTTLPSTATNPNLVSTAALAQLFGLSEKSIYGLAQRGIIRRARNAGGQEISGRYNVIEATGDYCDYLRAEAYGRSQSESSWRDEKTGLARAQRQKAELELALFKGETLLLKDVQAVVSLMVGNFRSRLLAFPARTARLILDMKDLAAIMAILREVVEEAIAELRERTGEDFRAASSAYVRALDAEEDGSGDQGEDGGNRNGDVI
jgi:phage terminase Nu1 subunit (DNA packaging protein)